MDRLAATTAGERESNRGHRITVQEVLEWLSSGASQYRQASATVPSGDSRSAHRTWVAGLAASLQDRALERQRLRERLANDAGMLATESERALAAWEAVLTGVAQSSAVAPSRDVFLVFSGEGMLRRGGVPLPYYLLVDSGKPASM
jgi:hypothetical protein